MQLRSQAPQLHGCSSEDAKHELSPLTLAESVGVPADGLRLRGGVPESVLAADRAASRR